MLCIYAYRFKASVNCWELPSLKAFTKIKMLTLIHVKNRVHLILYAKLIEDQLTASVTARQGILFGNCVVQIQDER